MSDNYLLYDPAIFGAMEIKEDTRDAEILRLRAENERLLESTEYYKNKDAKNGRDISNLVSKTEKLRAALAAEKALTNACERVNKRNDELLEQIHTLRTALKNLLADVQDYERVNNLYPNPGKTHCWESARTAAAALKETGDE